MDGRGPVLRAERPERVTVGICWQLEPGDEASCFARPDPRPGQVSEVRFAASESRGSTWARAQALALARDGEFVPMIDAPMRFADGWDRRLIERLLEAPGAKNALTGWLPAYLPPKALQPGARGNDMADRGVRADATRAPIGASPRSGRGAARRGAAARADPVRRRQLRVRTARDVRRGAVRSARLHVPGDHSPCSR